LRSLYDFIGGGVPVGENIIQFRGNDLGASHLCSSMNRVGVVQGGTQFKFFLKSDKFRATSVKITRENDWVCWV
jgi:hypothetical protein